MAQPFPATLQDFVNEDGFALSTGETSIRTEMDVGLPKVRRRFTKGIDLFTVTMDIHKSLYTTLNDFYNTTLNGGADTFLFDHPISGIEEEFRFISSPSYNPLGGEYFRVSMTWELMP